ncbi:MAG TPA: ATP-binding protein [Thermoanaerobaculia bacterium]|nr:ATP-binding protein [Thermoanaerobaculia bacterium]
MSNDPAPNGDLFAAILNGAGVGIAVLDPQRRIVVANAAFCSLLGCAKENLDGIDERDLTDDTDADLFGELFSGARPRYTIDKRYRYKDGAGVWGRVTMTMLRGEYAIAVVEDITAKRDIEQAADEARRAHERYALVARATNDVIWDWDAEHGTIVWNDALQTMFGYAPDQIDNRLQWWDSHLHPDDRERVVSGINGIIEKGGSSWTDEYRFERADGSFTEVLDRGYVARSEDGTPVRMIGAMLDVTERKRAERVATFMAEASAVLASSLDYHATLARVAELTVPVLADWCIVDLRTGNETYERLAVVHEDATTASDAFAEDVREVIISGTPKLIERVTNTLDIRSALIVPLVVVGGDRPLGALTLAMSHSRRVLSERDRPVVEDVARRAAMAIEHARLYDDAQKANLAKDEFLAILSHELSTPLTIILGWSGILRREDVSPEELQQGVESIRAGALAQAQLIDDVLDLSRVTTGKLRLDVQPVSIGQLVADSLTAVRVAAAAKRIAIIAPDTTAAGTVLGDGNRLRQVIWNLLTNAIKFTPAGGKVTVELENTPSAVRLIVTDTGKGIARDFLAHVFEPFRQGDASTTRAHGGLGLGLAIVRHLVEGHGGTVAAFSDGVERGARFVVELPSVPESSATSKHVHSSRSELAGVRVLFVDDQADARDLARVVFSNAGAESTITSSASEALEALDRLPIDIVVADIAMPEVDGYALIGEIRRRDALAQRHTPAIAATAYRSDDDRARAIAAGFDAYVKKPMDAATLTSTVAGVMAARTR